MSFRNLDENGDWVFGTGRNSYVTETQEVLLNVKTRVLSFLGDCFFAPTEGIDWWNLLEYNRQEKVVLDTQNVIATTDGVVELVNIDSYLDSRRDLHLTYSIKDIYSNTTDNEIIPII